MLALIFYNYTNTTHKKTPPYGGVLKIYIFSYASTAPSKRIVVLLFITSTKPP